MFFSDLHVQLLSRGILNPGEQLVSQTVTSYMPWWAFGFIRRQYLVLATDQRLVLVDHRYSFWRPTTQRLHGVESMPWSNVQETKVVGFLKKKLKVRGQSDHGPIALKMPIPNAFFGLLAPMKNNMLGARSVAAAATQSIGGGAPALGAGAGTGYGAPQISYPPAAPQLQAYNPPPASGAYGQPPQSQSAYGQPPVSGAYGQPPASGGAYGQPPQSQGAYGQMPAINSPGYNSVPPPPAHAQYVAPVASPFDPPRQY